MGTQENATRNPNLFGHDVSHFLTLGDLALQREDLSLAKGNRDLLMKRLEQYTNDGSAYFEVSRKFLSALREEEEWDSLDKTKRLADLYQELRKEIYR